jgi:Domain of unknown function (DUF4271)
MKGPGYFIICLFFLCSIVSITNAQEAVVVKNFTGEWKVFQNGQYEPYVPGAGGVRNIFFSVEANNFPESFLQVSSPVPLTLFINGQIAASSNDPLLLSIDSLAEIFQSRVLQINILQEEIHPGSLLTNIQANIKPLSSVEDHSLMRFSTFRDFAIVGMLILMVMLIIIIQINPKLTSDYFSVAKIFSMREGEDGQSHSRITSSINILFYAYCSLMLGYFLIIIFHYVPSHYASAISFQGDTFFGAVIQWLELSLIVLVLCFVKITLVYSLSFVFGMPEIGGIHFFNWVRLLLGVFGILTAVLFLYFIGHGQQEGFYIFLLRIMSWVLAGWMILIIFKLYRQAGHSMFHLFSYICATELIPFLITIKVLYY